MIDLQESFTFQTTLIKQENESYFIINCIVVIESYVIKKDLTGAYITSGQSLTRVWLDSDQNLIRVWSDSYICILLKSDQTLIRLLSDSDQSLTVCQTHVA